MSESEENEDVLFDVTGSRGEDQQLLKTDQGEPNKLSGKAWGRVKNIFTRKSQYPSSVFFILGTEFCERFTYYGLRTVLVLYLTGWLAINKNTATALFHLFSFFAYFSPILGAVIADGYLGRYRTILYISTIYGIGCIILSLTALPPPELVGPLIGLLLIAAGTGGIKPCVVTFGGDQFSDDQVKERNTFFSTFYFVINLGSVISTFVTPILRADVHCIENSCYPLAFAVPALLMLISVGIFFAGRKSYKHVPVTGSLFSRVFSCIMHGLRMRCKYRKYQDDKSHWLDYAGDKFEIPFIEEVKQLLTVLWLFLPLPMFWALFNQQGSRWTLQAAELDGSMGPFGRLKPDQMQVLNPLLIIVLIPVFERVIYPLLNRCRIPNRPLQRMVAGMTFSILAFCVAAFLQIKIDSLKDSVPSGDQAGYTFINTASCDLSVGSTPPLSLQTLPAEGMSEYGITEAGVRNLTVTCSDWRTHLSTSITLNGGTSSRIVIAESSHALTLHLFPDERTKSSDGMASASFLQLLYKEHPETLLHVVPEGASQKHAIAVNVTVGNASSYSDFEPGRYTVFFPRTDKAGHTFWQQAGQPFSLGGGGVYTVATLHPSPANQTSDVDVLVFNTVKQNSLSMMLMVPQYIIITVGEILFSVSGLGFAYTQAPESMKSLVQAAWLMTTAFGDLIVVIVAEVRLVPNQVAEFFLFAALMALDTLIFSIMGYFYTYTSTGLHSMEETRTDGTRLVESEYEDLPLQERDSQIK